MTEVLGMPPPHFTDAQYANPNLAHSIPRTITTKSVKLGCSVQLTHNSLQVFQTSGHALCGRNFRFSKLEVLFHDGASRVRILRESMEEGGKVDVSLADDRENLIFDGFLES